MTERISLADFPPKPNVPCNEPPVAHHLHRLPLEKLPWEDFERLCVRLAKINPDAEHAQAYGIRGQSQEGIDLYVRRRSDGRYIVWQCKRYQAFGKKDLRDAVNTFLKSFKSKAAGIPVKDADILILAVTADLSDVKVVKELERLAKRLRKLLNLRLIAYDIYGLSDELKKHRVLVEDFFNPAMADAFCGIKPPAITEDFGQLAAFRTALQVAQEGLASSGNTELDQIRDLWGERRELEALAKLAEFKNATTWSLRGAEVQAKALRIEAGLKLATDDVASAQKLYEESKRIAPAANARILEGKLLYHHKSPEAALTIFDSPSTDDEWVFRWTLLLELGRSEEVVKEAAALRKQKIPPGDFSAVLSLAQLAQLDVNSATQTIQVALQEKPHHASSRYVGAVVDYYSGISTAFRAWRHMIWPVPPTWNLVKRDTESMERRNRAAQTFLELLPSSPPRDVAQLQAWHLACVALNANTAVQPSELAQIYLTGNSQNVPLLVWATALELNIDSAKSVAALRGKLDEGNGTLEDLLSLFGLLDDKSDFATIESLLVQHRQLFVKAEREPLWFLHQAQVLIEQGKIAEGMKIVDKMPNTDDGDHIRLAIQQLAAEKSKSSDDYHLLAKSLEAEYSKTKSPDSLLACCRTHRLLQQWDFIAQHADELVREVATQSALELAAEGLLHSRHEQDCLRLLEDHRALCAGENWTPFLRQLAAECHRLRGDFPNAISELNQAVAASQGIAAKMQLFRTQLQKGDLPASLQTARLLSNDPSVPAEFLVGQIIPVARHHDIEFARELIIKLHTSEAKLLPAVQLKLMDEASRAGVNTVFESLVGKLTQQAVAGEGPLKAFSYEQARDMLIERRKKSEEIWSAYTRGEIPSHCLTSGLNLPPGKLFHQIPRSNMEQCQPALSAAISTRYANDANAQPYSISLDTKELFLDVTSFFLLDALALLPTVESTFERIHIGSSLVQCLEEHLDQLSPTQPERAIARQKVTELLEQSRLKLWPEETTPLPADSALAPLVLDMGVNWCQHLLQTQAKSGLVVDFLPLHPIGNMNRSVVLPDELSKAVVSVPQLIHAMQQTGWVASIHTSPGMSPICLRDWMPIHLEGGQAEELALAGVLQTLCEKAQVTLNAEDAARMQQEVSKENNDAKLKADVGRLLAHLSNDIDKGKYQVHVGKPIKLESHEAPFESWVRALAEAIGFGENHSIPVCVDDRMIRRHSATGIAPLCDSWDILHHLRDRNAINLDAFHEFRAKMRAANLRYLPVSPEEIVACVQRAPIQNDQLAETPELACLRRYVAATLLGHATLQGPLRDATGLGDLREGVWPVKLQAAIIKSLPDVWQKADPANNHAEIQADWIWSNLYFDQRLLAELFGYKQPDYDPKDAMADPVGSLFAFGIGLYESASSSEDVRNRRTRYFRWVEDRCITPFLPNNPDLWSRAARHLRRISSFLNFDVQKLREQKSDNNIHTMATRHLLATFIADLPPQFAHALAFTAEELTALGLVSYSPCIELHGLQFPSEDFWETIARALRNGHAALWTPNRKSKLRMKYDRRANRLLVSPTGLINKGWSGLNVPFLPLLSDNQHQREVALRSEAAAFDQDEPKLSAIILEISNCPSAAERVCKRADYREQSSVARYIELSQSLRDKKSVEISDLLPNQIDCLRRYLRLELADKSPEDFAARLVKSVGWSEAMVRMSRLPVQLPAAIISEWQQLTADEQSTRLQELESKLVSPIERMRFVELLCHPTTSVPEKLTRAKTQLTWLLEEKSGQAHGRAMLATVRWVHLRLGWHAEASKWPAFVRLCVAWSHGCAVHRAFQVENSTPNSLQQWFANNSQELFADNFSLTDEAWHDAANPFQLRISTLVLKDIASSCGKLTDEKIRQLGVQQMLPQILSGESFAELADLWADRSLGDNLLGSYLANIADDELRRAIGETVFEERIRLHPRAAVEQAMSALTQNPLDLKSRALVNFIVGGRPLYAELREIIPNIFSKIDFVEVFKTSPNDCAALIMQASQLAASSMDSSLVKTNWDKCLRLAEHLASANPKTEAGRILHAHLAASLADAAIRSSASIESRQAGLKMSLASLSEIASRWPAFLKHHGHALSEVFSRVSVSELAGYPHFLLMVRSRV